MPLNAQAKEPGEIHPGDQHRFEVSVDEPLVKAFAELSGDFNPLHVNADYAHSAGYRNPIAHGALQVAWVSQAVGMWLIGVRCLVHKISSAFLAPLIYPCRIAVESRLESWNPKHGMGQALIVVKNAQTGEVFSKHTVEVGVQIEGKNKEVSIKKTPASLFTAKTIKGSRPAILVTGGTGGMLRQLVTRLLERYDVVLLGRNESALKDVFVEVGSPKGLEILPVDLVKEVDHLETKLDAHLAGRPFWAVIHGASLPIIQESILEVDAARLAEEWTMTATVPLRLSRWLSAKCGEMGGRILLIGSESTKPLPQLHALPRAHLYGLGKRFLRETAHILAQELASRKITVNTLHPGPIPRGMNAGMSPSRIRMLEAENPMKRLCNDEDLAAAIFFFLGEESGYVSGQDLYLNGGRF